MAAAVHCGPEVEISRMVHAREETFPPPSHTGRVGGRGAVSDDGSLFYGEPKVRSLVTSSGLTPKGDSLAYQSLEGPLACTCRWCHVPKRVSLAFHSHEEQLARNCRHFYLLEGVSPAF